MYQPDISNDPLEITAEQKLKETTDAFFSNLRLRSRFEHANIVALLGFIWTWHPTRSIIGLGMLLERMDEGSLKDILKADAAMFTPATRMLQWQPQRHSAYKSKLSIMIDIVKAVAYIHSFQDGSAEAFNLKRHLESSNILLSQTWEAKLGGYDVSLPSLAHTNDIEGDPSSSSTNALRHSTACMAPEVLRGDAWSEASDVYVFGMLIYELDLGRHPYKDPATGEAMVIMEESVKPKFSAECPEAIQDIVQKCLARKAKDRPTSVQIQFWLQQIQDVKP
jgi:serine/threonine protein kinase